MDGPEDEGPEEEALAEEDEAGGASEGGGGGGIDGRRQRQQKHLEADLGACFVKLWRLAGCYSALKAGDGGLLNLGAARACARAKQEGGAALEHVCLHGELRWPASWAVQEATEPVSGGAKRMQKPAAVRWRSKLGSGGLALVCVWRAPGSADLSLRGSTMCVKQHRLAGVCYVRWLRWTAGRRRGSELESFGGFFCCWFELWRISSFICFFCKEQGRVVLDLHKEWNMEIGLDL
ncbi:hypothetical protein Taro_008731 [Colocasia esculenta]|uniref:Uncharacterized protein n=1 Tax=Colocasia esculenta TaxID=4460 RepID=A0A843U3V2_COLES|nr:hypothetical protein [Colocasia esculenta]